MIDVKADTLIGTVRRAPRRGALRWQMTTSLYVVNYLDGTISKVKTADMSIVQTINVGGRPIGIAYDALTSVSGWPTTTDASSSLKTERLAITSG